jgi:hypothetical protein
MIRGKRKSKLIHEIDACPACIAAFNSNPDFKIKRDLCPICFEKYMNLIKQRVNKRNKLRRRAAHMREILAVKRKNGTVKKKVPKGVYKQEEPFARPISIPQTLVANNTTRLAVVRQNIEVYENMLKALRSEEALLTLMDGNHKS